MPITTVFSLLVALCLLCGHPALASNILYKETTPIKVSQPKRSLGSFVAPDTKLEAVFAWVKKQGGHGLDNIRIGLFDKAGHKVRGLAATRDLPAKSEVLSIPSNVILTLQHPTVQDSPFQKVDSELGGLLLRLPLFLAAERRKLLNGKTSFWAPWIKSLPSPEEFASFHPYYAEPGLMTNFSALPLVL